MEEMSPTTLKDICSTFVSFSISPSFSCFPDLLVSSTLADLDMKFLTMISVVVSVCFVAL